ncbi:putative toxin-antitoxin system toxin component, PIN family [Bacteroidales bacterium Barb7]|nr:putative toxin-antitoxin system toxin component, PIN family [Bacteroidales bacterium Barb7]
MKKVNKTCKVIIDTNIWISFLIGKNLKGLQKYIYYETVFIITCKEQIVELTEVFQKPKIRKYFPQAKIDEFFDLLGEVSLLADVTTISDICRDPKDNYLLALAIDADADYLITGDADLLDIRQIEKASIVSFSDFEKIMATL